MRTKQEAQPTFIQLIYFLGRKGIAEKLEGKEIASFEEVLLSNVYTQEALINLLERKGILNKAELLEEIKRVRAGTRNGGSS